MSLILKVLVLSIFHVVRWKMDESCLAKCLLLWAPSPRQKGVIWPSLSPYTVINPILLTYLPRQNLKATVRLRSNCLILQNSDVIPLSEYVKQCPSHVQSLASTFVSHRRIVTLACFGLWTKFIVNPPCVWPTELRI